MIPRLTVSRLKTLLGGACNSYDFMNGDRLIIVQKLNNSVKCIFTRKGKVYEDFVVVKSNDFDDLKNDKEFLDYLSDTYYSELNSGWVSR